MPTKKRLIGNTTSCFPDSWHHSSKGGEAMLCCFREEEEETMGARQTLLWIAILSSNDSNGFTSFKINVLKQRFSILFQASSCSAHTLLHLSLSFSLSLSLSLIQIINSAPTMNCSIYTQLWEVLYMDVRAFAVLNSSFNQDKTIY